MENPTYIAMSRLMAQQRTMDVIADNIANANTPGFKAERVQFSDWMLRAHGAASRAGEQVIDFTQDRATWRDQSAGSLEHTGEPLDLALGGEGFFSVQTSQGVRLTRSGRFALEAAGAVVDSSGNRLLDEAGSPVTIPPGDRQITVAGDGTISTETGRIAKLGVVVPSDPNSLVAEGGHLFRTERSTRAAAHASVVQGAIEDSNVSPMLEMTRMMDLGREFQFVSQFVEHEADRQQSAIDALTAAPQT